jgi:hypothetical protein
MRPDTPPDVPSPTGGTRPPPAPVRATVEHAGTATSYLRFGRGPVVLFLGGGSPSPHAGALVAALAADFRVIVPESVSIRATVTRHEGPDTAFAWWLRGVLDGLGIVRARFVAEAALAHDVLRFVECNPERAECLALVGYDRSAAAACDRLPAMPSPTLAVGEGDVGVAEVLRFLAASSGAAPSIGLPG